MTGETGRAGGVALWAAVYGALAGLGAYVAVVLSLAVQVLSMGSTTAGGLGARAFLFGTLGDFFGSHLGVTDGIALGVAGVGTVPEVVYYLFPPLVLAWCGRRSALAATPRSAREAFLRGASVVVGYCLVVSLALAALSVAVEFALIALDPLSALLVAGLLYPLVFGGLGGLTTRLTRQSGRHTGRNGQTTHAPTRNRD